uniref:RNA-directed DNA polymerase, eukaryota n=1 Tax=Tanacetum cinerariifolium TaxID=118510 RepID=A0A6L2JE72_TANCI|nr:RNA-directed DNA polymerase, eukaryota [Tanacetum cinerariifolium]
MGFFKIAKVAMGEERISPPTLVSFDFLVSLALILLDGVVEHISETKGSEGELVKEAKIDHVSESCCMNNKEEEYENHGTSKEEKNNSKDPFRIYELLNKSKEKVVYNGDDLTFPLGFTLDVIEETDMDNKDGSTTRLNVNLHGSNEGTLSARSGSNSFRRASVTAKFGDSSLVNSFRQAPRGGEFSVRSARSYIDDALLPTISAPTRWVSVVPIKINIFAWRVSLDRLPTQINLSLCGIDISSILCLIYSCARESSSHLLFSCNVARLILLKVARW